MTLRGKRRWRTSRREAVWWARTNRSTRWIVTLWWNALAYRMLPKRLQLCQNDWSMPRCRVGPMIPHSGNVSIASEAQDDRTFTFLRREQPCL